MAVQFLKLSKATHLSSLLQSSVSFGKYSCTSNIVSRYLSSSASDGEQKIRDVVLKNFPKAQTVNVTDISGGCGAMFDVHIESPDFIGKKLVQQHMMVNKALKSEIADMHGIRITTKPTSE